MLSEQMLRRSPALAALGPVAAAHHEKADGSGYHRRLHGDATERGARILSATDIYVGLTTERADRPTLTDGHAATEVPAGVDGRAWWRCASGCSRCRQKGR